VSAYYNEFDPYVAQWLRNLIAAGYIPAGDVDERSIEDVRPSELARYTQCHFFAGVGGWAYALALAGWPSDRPVWTGSCPCQPFSAAGKRAGFADQRHLWPAWFHLIRECRPTVLFGEQVASAADWLSLVCGDLEGVGYAVGSRPVEAASAGAEHYRDRYWIVAHDDEQRSSAGGLQRGWELSGPGSDTSNLARTLADRPSFGWGEGWTEHDFRSRGFTAPVVSAEGRQYVECTDGKQPVWRRLPPPRVRWLGTGIPARVAKLRAFGNAIDPRPAAEFIQAYVGARAELAPALKEAA
jgi:DNA (cytosine-5)-methyltransferase 1